MVGVDCARPGRCGPWLARRDDIRGREHQQLHNQAQQRNYHRYTTHRRLAQLDGYEVPAGSEVRDIAW